MIEPGTKVKVRGERDIYRLCRYTIASTGLVSVVLVGSYGFRAVRPENVKPIVNPRRRHTQLSLI